MEAVTMTATDLLGKLSAACESLRPLFPEVKFKGEVEEMEDEGDRWLAWSLVASGEERDLADRQLQPSMEVAADAVGLDAEGEEWGDVEFAITGSIDI